MVCMMCYGVLWYYVVWHSIVLYRAVCMVWYNMLCGAVWYGVVYFNDVSRGDFSKTITYIHLTNSFLSNFLSFCQDIIL